MSDDSRTDSGHTNDLASIEAENPAALVLPMDSAQAIRNLISLITSMGLPRGVTTSLTATLININPMIVNSACGKLNAFLSKVEERLNSGDLTLAQANQLRDAANAIKAGLGC